MLFRSDAFVKKTVVLSDLIRQRIDALTKQGNLLTLAFTEIDKDKASSSADVGPLSKPAMVDVVMIDKAALAPVLFVVTAAGLGKTGLGSATAPAIADPANPTAAELRRLAIWTNYRAILDPVAAGDRIGMIRFGSRVDVYLPEGGRPLVAEGQTALAGETILADLTLTDAAWTYRAG